MKPPYRVRKQSAGSRGTFDAYIVVKLGGGRATTWPHVNRADAQAEADRLNVGDMVRDYAEDPRPYDVRRADAQRDYEERVAR